MAHYSTSNIGSLLFALLWATVVKLSLSIVTIGSRIPAGTFVPALVWGALIGRIVGEIVQYLHLSFPWFVLFSSCPPEQSCVTPGMYSLLGAMSSLGVYLPLI
jgi:chloride channel 3/4/5